MTVEEAILNALKEGADPEWLESLCLEVIEDWKQSQEGPEDDPSQ